MNDTNIFNYVIPGPPIPRSLQPLLLQPCLIFTPHLCQAAQLCLHSHQSRGRQRTRLARADCNATHTENTRLPRLIRRVRRDGAHRTAPRAKPAAHASVRSLWPQRERFARAVRPAARNRYRRMPAAVQFFLHRRRESFNLLHVARIRPAGRDCAQHGVLRNKSAGRHRYKRLRCEQVAQLKQSVFKRAVAVYGNRHGRRARARDAAHRFAGAGTRPANTGTANTAGSSPSAFGMKTSWSDRSKNSCALASELPSARATRRTPPVGLK